MTGDLKRQNLVCSMENISNVDFQGTHNVFHPLVKFVASSQSGETIYRIGSNNIFEEGVELRNSL